MSNSDKVVFGYGATDSKTQWKRLGRMRNPSLERGDEGIRTYGLVFAEGVTSCPFAITVTLTVDCQDQADDSLAAQADAMFLDMLPGHSLTD